MKQKVNVISQYEFEVGVRPQSGGRQRDNETAANEDGFPSEWKRENDRDTEADDRPIGGNEGAAPVRV